MIWCRIQCSCCRNLHKLVQSCNSLHKLAAPPQKMCKKMGRELRFLLAWRRRAYQLITTPNDATWLVATINVMLMTLQVCASFCKLQTFACFCNILFYVHVRTGLLFNGCISCHAAQCSYMPEMLQHFSSLHSTAKAGKGIKRSCCLSVYQSVCPTSTTQDGLFYSYTVIFGKCSKSNPLAVSVAKVAKKNMLHSS